MAPFVFVATSARRTSGIACLRVNRQCVEGAEPALRMPAYLFVETAHLFHRLLHMLKVGRVFEWPVALVDQLELSC